jgi:hypothetical protein
VGPASGSRFFSVMFKVLLFLLARTPKRHCDRAAVVPYGPVPVSPVLADPLAVH